LRKATVSFIMSVRPSVRVEHLGSHWTDFHEVLYWSIFAKFYREKVSLNSDKNNRYCTWVVLVTSLWIRRVMRNVSDKSCRDNQNTHFVFKNYIRRELRITCILDTLDEYRRNCLSHLQRMPQNRIPLKSYHYRPQGRRTIGRPKKRWREQL